MGSIASEGPRGVFLDYEQHSKVGQTSTKLVLSASLRAHYPNHTLAIVSPYSCDLLGFAKAGHATAELDASKDSYLSSRSYAGLPTRWSEGEGSVVDKLVFGRYNYDWYNHSFVLYVVECAQTYKCPETTYFILHQAKPEELVQSNSTVVDELISTVSQWAMELHDEILVYDGYWTKDKQLWKAVKDSKWDDVILDKDTKKALIDDVEGFYSARDAYKRFAIQWKRGIILHGPPGNGKTISIKALMNSLYARVEPIPSLYVKSFESCGGEQAAIKDIFTKARATAPCFLVLEDLDSLVTDKLRSYFLNEVDGLQSNDGILILGSTNHLEKLDPAIVKRPSRFDRKYPFQPPVLAERLQYCNFWMKKLEDVHEVRYSTSDHAPIAEMTDGFTFAYLKEAFVATLFHLFANQAEAKAGDGKDGTSVFVKAFATEVEVLREQMSEKSEEEKKKEADVKIVVETTKKE